MLVLSIETSCDETAAAVVRDGRQILSSIVATQIDIHAEYGGVVPEIASRKHLESVTVVIQSALDSAKVAMKDIEGVAVTRGPGLIGALLVGISAAKGISLGLGVPLAAVNHIEAHLLAPMLENEVQFPFVALVVSGGHTHLYHVRGVGDYTTLGQTIDDAAGEAYDKVAKLLGMPYPGGARIDKLAASGNPSAIRFPRPLMHDGTLNFSFSGLKTAVMNHLRKHPECLNQPHIYDLCASFQAAVCEILAAKTRRALQESGCKRLVVAGGVACNSGLRSAMSGLTQREGIELFFPSPALCADNAAMIAVPGDFYLSRGIASLDFDALPNWPLDLISKQLAGRL